MAEAVAKRSQIPDEKRWAVEDLFEHAGAWETAFAQAMEETGKAENYKGRLGESAAALREYLDYENELDIKIEKIYLYAHLNMDTDTTDMAGQSM